MLRVEYPVREQLLHGFAYCLAIVVCNPVGIGQAHFKQEFQVGGGKYVLDNNGTTVVGANIAVTKKFDNSSPVFKYINIRASALIGPTVSQPVLKNGNEEIARAAFKTVGVGATMGISPIVNLTKNWSVFVKGSVNFTTYKANFGSNGVYQNNTIGVGIGTGVIFRYFVQPYEDEINKIFNKPPFILKFK